jgi:hypothetical protein
MKNVVFWDVTPCGSCKNWFSEELSASLIRVTIIGELGTTLDVTSSRRTQFTDSCHPNEGGAKVLRNVGYYKNNTA